MYPRLVCPSARGLTCSCELSPSLPISLSLSVSCLSLFRPSNLPPHICVCVCACVCVAMLRTFSDKGSRGNQVETATVAPLICCKGHCIPLSAAIPSLNVVRMFVCSVASLSRYPSPYLPCQLRIPEAATADDVFVP